jgi:hypothetical protein
VEEAQGRGEACLIIDDEQGHHWHVLFEEVEYIPRVGEALMLPPDLRPHKVLSVEHYFFQEAPPVTLHGEESSKYVYAKPAQVVLKVRQV